MRLVIESQSAILGMRTQNAAMNRQTTLPKVNLKTEPIQLDIQTTQPKIQIDQRQCFAESGLKGILALVLEENTRSVSTMYEGVGRVVEQGNALTEIQYGGNPIADQAYENAYDQFSREFNMVTMPRSRPNITVIRGDVNIKVRGGTVQKEFVKGSIESQYQPGKVEIYNLQERSFKMRFEKTQFDQKG